LGWVEVVWVVEIVDIGENRWEDGEVVDDDLYISACVSM
jgi:hypothetical protein